MRKFITFTGVAAVMALSACDSDSNLERAVVGGALGCVAGEVVFNGRCVEGGAVGAAAGVVTN